MPSSTRLTISNDFLEAEIAPHLGARLCRLRTRNDAVDLVVPLDTWNAPEHGWPKAGAYPLAPYSNRIREARFVFRNKTWTLAPHPPDWPNALHGHTQRCVWQVAHVGSQRAELVLRTEANENWPWSLESSVIFELTGNTIGVSLAVRNRSEHAMPAGLGWHPFFAIDSESKVHFRASRDWEINAKCLPTGRWFPTQAPVELTRESWAAHDYVQYASEWDGTALIERDAGTVRVTTGAPLTHLVVFAAHNSNFVCLEPVSHVADGFNLAAEGTQDTGMQVLEPGESLAARVALAWEPKD